MKTKIDTINAALADAIQGEPAPGFDTPAFKSLLGAVTGGETSPGLTWGNPSA